MPYPGWVPTPGCLANIKKLNGRPCEDPNTHCYDTQDYTHQVCDCSGQFLGGCTSSPPPTPAGCCPYTGDSPIPSYDKQGMCYCCCSCFAYDTPIAFEMEGALPAYRAVQDFNIGDPVLAAGADLKWTSQPLQFSAGAPAKKSMLIKVDYLLEGNPESLLVTRGHLFFTPEGKLIRADRLRLGDPLVIAAGGTTPVVALTAGVFDKGVHHIATSRAAATGLDGHLLNSRGIVTGDYALQISSVVSRADSALLVEGHEDLPVFGTEAHAALTTAYLAAESLASAPEPADGGTGEGGDARPKAADTRLTSVGPAHPEPDGFVALGKTTSYPVGTQSYFTDAQAWNIQASDQRAPVGSAIGTDMARYVMKLFGGMYPTINFQFDEHDDTPNAYAFEEYNMRFVVFTSGLARTMPLMLESAIAIVAHCVARLQKIEPVNQAGYSCRSTADYASLSVIGFLLRGNLFATVVPPAIDQLGALFALVAPENAGPVPGDTCMRPGLACRIDTLRAAMSSMPRPECAGGPPAATLELVQAEGAVTNGEKSEVTLRFSAAVDPATVGLPANYQFDPPASVEGAAPDPDDPAKVIVRSEAGPATRLIDVIGVKSLDGHGMRPSASSATIEWN